MNLKIERIGLKGTWAVSRFNRGLSVFEGGDTPMHTTDIKNRCLNINQTNNWTSDTASKVCIKFLNYW